MTKSEKLAEVIVDALDETSFERPLMTKKEKTKLISGALRYYLENIHNEAVLATIMAKNKKTYEEPKYID